MATRRYPVLLPLDHDGKAYGPFPGQESVVEMEEAAAGPLADLGVLGDALAEVEVDTKADADTKAKTEPKAKS